MPSVRLAAGFRRLTSEIHGGWPRGSYAPEEDGGRGPAGGVSTATVSRVLNNPELVSDDTRQRVADAIRQLDYRVNLAARSLRTNQTRTIAVVLPTIADPVINRMVEAVEDVAITAGYTLLLCSTRGDAAREQTYIELLTQQTVADGVLYISPRATPENVLALDQGVSRWCCATTWLIARACPAFCWIMSARFTRQPRICWRSATGGLRC